MKFFDIRLGAAALLACLWLPALAQNVEAGSKKAEPCFACHGAKGNSTLSAFPILAGLSMRYIYLQLKDFKEGRRRDPSMDALVANLTREDMLDLALSSPRKSRATTASSPIRTKPRAARRSPTKPCAACATWASWPARMRFRASAANITITSSSN
jgi:cytochrome c553